MSGYRLSRRALSDFDEIWIYSVEHWGIDRARRYLAQVRQAIERVAADPRRGRTCDVLRPGYRKYLVGAHVIFFRSSEDGIEVMRILHQRMDFARYL